MDTHLYIISGLSVLDRPELARLMARAGDYPTWKWGAWPILSSFDYVASALVLNHGAKASVVNGIFTKDAKRLIGTVVLLPDLESQDTARVMYFMDPDYRGRGIMKGAVRFVIHEAIERGWLKYAFGEVHPDKIASRNILENNGLREISGEGLRNYWEREGFPGAQHVFYKGSVPELNFAYHHPRRPLDTTYKRYDMDLLHRYSTAHA